MTESALPLPHSAAYASALPLRLFTDGRLSRLAADGDRRAFAAIYERHHEGMYRYCRSILRDSEDASDAVQATMMKALLALPAKRAEVPLRPWLYRIAHNEAISVQRRRFRREAEPAEETAMSPGADEIAIERRDLRELVSDLLALPERQRSALVMRELNGLEYDEIAVVLGTSGTAAKQTVYEARVALHERREGRETACARVRAAVSEGDRRVLRGRRISAHLKACQGCREFEQTMSRRSDQLASIAPALPGGGILAILKGLLGGGGGGGGGASGTAVGLAGGGGLASASTFNAAAALATLAVATGFAASKAYPRHDDGGSPRASSGASAQHAGAQRFVGGAGHLTTTVSLTTRGSTATASLRGPTFAALRSSPGGQFASGVPPLAATQDLPATPAPDAVRAPAATAPAAGAPGADGPAASPAATTVATTPAATGAGPSAGTSDGSGAGVQPTSSPDAGAAPAPPLAPVTVVAAPAGESSQPSRGRGNDHAPPPVSTDPPGRGGGRSPAEPPGHADGGPPAHSQGHPHRSDSSTPPGQSQRAADQPIPPGRSQDRPSTDDTSVPPGRGRVRAAAATPPGQAGVAPPGQAGGTSPGRGGGQANGSRGAPR